MLRRRKLGRAAGDIHSTNFIAVFASLHDGIQLNTPPGGARLNVCAPNPEPLIPADDTRSHDTAKRGYFELDIANRRELTWLEQTELSWRQSSKPGLRWRRL